MAYGTLLDIQNKVRKLTYSMTVATLPTPELNRYVNNYVLFHLPEQLRLFNLKKTFHFYTVPYVDTYTTTNINSPLYDFQNKYITTDIPVYIAGFQVNYSQSRNQFFNLYPLVNSIASIGTTGTGIINYFSGVINSQQTNVPNGFNQQICLLKNNVMFNSIDANGNGLVMQDTPILDSTSYLPTQYGSLYNPLVYNDKPYNPTTNPGGYPVYALPAPYIDQLGFPNINYINYLTGDFAVTFSGIPAAGATINSQTIPQSPARPQSILFYDGNFTLRPVPDQVYKVDMEVFVQPTELLTADQSPELKEWWELIAYGAAKLILEDRMDYETINTFLPSLQERELLAERRTIVQQTGQRASTIYSDGTNNFNNNNFGGYFW